MPQPTPGDVYVNLPLTNVVIAWMQDQSTFIADKAFPNVPVQQQGGKYFEYTRGDWFRIEAQRRAPGTESAGSGWNLDANPIYFADVWAVHKDIDDQTRANAWGPIDLDRDATEWVGQQMALRREKIWASTYFKTGVWTGGTAAADLVGVPGAPAAGQFKQWDQSGSTPIEDIQTQVIRMNEMTGYKPNTLILSPYVLMRLSQHAEILDRIKYTQRGIITEDILAAVFGVDRILVPGGVENTAREGAVDAMAFMYGKAALLVYAAPAPSLMKPSAGYTFSWTGYLGAGAQGQRIKTFRMEHLESDRVEGSIAFDCRVVAADLGVFFSAAVS